MRNSEVEMRNREVGLMPQFDLKERTKAFAQSAQTTVQPATRDPSESSLPSSASWRRKQMSRSFGWI